jgi:hypothetical protein
VFTLITAANSSKAYQLKNSLAGDNLVLGDYLELPEIMLKMGKMIQLPNPASIAYAHQMLTLCLDNDIDTIYPLRAEEYELLSKSAQLFSEYNIKLLFV